MAFKILTENSVDNTNIDGARAEHFNAGLRDGIVKGAFNEGTFTALASNVISFDTCELRISGHRVIIDEIWTQTFSSSPSVATRYALVGQIVVDSSSNVDFSLFVQNAATQLVKDNLFRTENGAGTYQVEIGRFTLTPNGTIADVKRTLDLITGGSSGMGEHFVAGNITTTMLDAGMDANVTAEDVYDANGDYKQTDFSFELPETAGTVVKVNNIEQANLDFTSDPQSQLNNKVDKETGKGLSTNDYTTTEKTKLGGIEAEANKTIVDSALSSTSENPVQNKVVASALPNPNILINGNFWINQRGISSKTTNGYTVDRWYLSGAKFSQNSGNKEVTVYFDNNDQNMYGHFVQQVSWGTFYTNRTVTLSVKINSISLPDSSSQVKLRVFNNDTVQTVGSIFWDSEDITTTGVKTFTLTLPSSFTKTFLVTGVSLSGKNTSVTIEYIKFEIGNVATSCIPRIYQEELVLCQAYYQKIGNSNYLAYGVGFNDNQNRVIINKELIVEMRGLPTIHASGTFRLQYYNTNISVNASAITMDNNSSSVNSVRLAVALPNSISTEHVFMLSGNNSETYIEFDAENY